MKNSVMFHNSSKRKRVLRSCKIIISLLIITLLIVGFFFIEKYISRPKVIISYWANYAVNRAYYPFPGSFNKDGQVRDNPDMRGKLNLLDIFNYAFFHVDKNGELHFNDSYVDLSLSDEAFCAKHKNICLDNSGKYHPKLGNFSAFVRLQNSTQSLKKLISMGGADDNTSFDNAILHID